MDIENVVKCCGCDCKNCILDKPEIDKPLENELNAINVIKRDIPRKFCLIDLKEFQIDVILFTFKYHDIKEENEENYILDIKPGQHIKIRGSKKFDPNNFNTMYNRFRSTICTEANILEYKRKSDFKKPLHYEDDGYVIRPYSPIMIDRKKLILQLLIKLQPGGTMSNYLETLNIGDCVDVIGPFGEFNYTPNEYKNIVCFSQGISLTPIYCVINSILENKIDETRITYYPCFINLENIFLHNEIYNLKKYWNFKSIIFLAREKLNFSTDCPNVRSKLKYNEIVRNEYLCSDNIKKLFDEGKFKPKSTLVLISGSEIFIKLIKKCVTTLDYKNYYEF